VSRRRHVYKQFPQLQVEIAHSIRAHFAVLDGEIVCFGPDGRSLFNRLLFRRDWLHFVAFDVLSIDGEDLRDRSLAERKRRLRAITPRMDSRLVYVDHVVGRGSPGGEVRRFQCSSEKRIRGRFTLVGAGQGVGHGALCAALVCGACRRQRQPAGSMLAAPCARL
jgi:ATP dependent DNA ligase-like protein